MAARLLVIKSRVECPEFRTDRSLRRPPACARHTLTATLLSAATTEFAELCRKSEIVRAQALRKFCHPFRVSRQPPQYFLLAYIYLFFSFCRLCSCLRALLCFCHPTVRRSHLGRCFYAVPSVRPFVRPFVRPVRYCYHDISRTA